MSFTSCNHEESQHNTIKFDNIITSLGLGGKEKGRGRGVDDMTLNSTAEPWKSTVRI
jgi:hypothetical protein